VPDAAPGDRKEAACLPDIIEHITGKALASRGRFGHSCRR